MRDGTQASFGKEVDLVIRQIQQGVKDFRRKLQEVERLGNSCSGHAQFLGQVCLGGTRAIFEEAFESERLSYEIDDGHGRFFVGRRWFSACGFNARYEELALMHSRKVNPKGQIKKVRESFGRAEPPVIYEL